MHVAQPSLVLAIAALAKVSSAQWEPWLGWDDLEPSTSLNFTKCYSGQYKCAKLRVPLDWLNPELETETKVDLAVIALPAVVDEGDPSFGGTIITNPGGPGGSGVMTISGGSGLAMQMTVDGEKHYEVLSFDPRGVGLSTPNADCYNDPLARYLNDREIIGMGNWTANDDVLRRYIAKQEQFNRRCQLTGQEDEHDIRNYMSTTTAARDMLHIVDKLGELRNDGEKLKRTEADLPRLQYWGFSYGTALGSYFASMFPGRVERMLLEGVMDASDYAEGTWFSSGLADLDKAYQFLWDSCFAKKEKCALYTPEDKSAGDIRARVEDWLEDLDKNPTIWDSGIFTSWQVYQTLFSPGAYIPTMVWESMANSLSEMMNGNIEAFKAWSSLPGAGATCPVEISQQLPPWNADTVRAIACGDGPDLSNVTFEEYKSDVESIHRISPQLGTPFTHHRAACMTWSYRPKDRFTGPWGSPRPDPSRVEGKPTAPILFTSSEIDPVTPLRSAFKMSRRHLGSGVLVHAGSAHTNLGIPSECRHKWLRRYFATGKLPPKGTVCKMECEPFEECRYFPEPEFDDELSERGEIRKTAAARSWAEFPRIDWLRF